MDVFLNSRFIPLTWWPCGLVTEIRIVKQINLYVLKQSFYTPHLVLLWFSDWNQNCEANKLVDCKDRNAQSLHQNITIILFFPFVYSVCVPLCVFRFFIPIYLLLWILLELKQCLACQKESLPRNHCKSYELNQNVRNTKFCVSFETRQFFSALSNPSFWW